MLWDILACPSGSNQANEETNDSINFFIIDNIQRHWLANCQRNPSGFLDHLLNITHSFPKAKLNKTIHKTDKKWNNKAKKKTWKNEKKIFFHFFLKITPPITGGTPFFVNPYGVIDLGYITNFCSLKRCINPKIVV